MTQRVRTYVDVVMYVSSGGTETPKAIIMPDGRVYEVKSTSTREKTPDGMAMTVQIGDRTTKIYKDSTGWNGARWYVMMRQP